MTRYTCDWISNADSSSSARKSHRRPPGWTVDRMDLVAGTVSDATIDPITVSINGVRYLVRRNGGA